MLYRLEILGSRSALRTSPKSCGHAIISKTPSRHWSRSSDAAPDAARVPAIRQSASTTACTLDQVRDDRDGDVRDRRVSLPSWTTRCARSWASSSPRSAFALMRSMIPNPSRRAASSTSESRLPILAARTLTRRIRPSSIASVVFTRAISPYYHLAGEMLRQSSSAGCVHRVSGNAMVQKRPLLVICLTPRF
jgi:hypothetical protein